MDYYAGHYSRKVSRNLLRDHRGDPADPLTWEAVAAARHHHWHWFLDPDSGPGQFASCEYGTGCICINASFPPGVQARAVAHELAHAELGRMYLCVTPNQKAGYDMDPEEL